MLLETQSKLESIMALLLPRVIVSLLESFIAISSFFFPHTFTAKGNLSLVFYVLKSWFLLNSIGNA